MEPHGYITWEKPERVYGCMTRVGRASRVLPANLLDDSVAWFRCASLLGLHWRVSRERIRLTKKTFEAKPQCKTLNTNGGLTNIKCTRMFVQIGRFGFLHHPGMDEFPSSTLCVTIPQ
jgi:hypothetical protein